MLSGDLTQSAWPTTWSQLCQDKGARRHHRPPGEHRSPSCPLLSLFFSSSQMCPWCGLGIFVNGWKISLTHSGFQWTQNTSSREWLPISSIFRGTSHIFCLPLLWQLMIKKQPLIKAFIHGFIPQWAPSVFTTLWLEHRVVGLLRLRQRPPHRC